MLKKMNFLKIIGVWVGINTKVWVRKYLCVIEIMGGC